MSNQLALELALAEAYDLDAIQEEVAGIDAADEEPVAAPRRETFTARQFGASARLTPEEARSYLVDFQSAGIVERVPGGWRFTTRGQAIARDLARFGGGVGE